VSSMSTDARQDVRESGDARRHRNRNRWVAVAVLLAVALLAAAGLRAVINRDSWEVVWSDDFDGAEGSAPSTRNWLHSTGTSYPGGAQQWGTGEIQTYVDDREHSSLDGDGRLKITATQDGDGTWRSARMETRRTDFEPPDGGVLKVEAEVRQPDGGAGYWSAFWMLGAAFRGNYVNWPGIGEIDVMEFKGGTPSDVYGTLHCGVAPGGPCGENNGIGGKYTSGDPLTERFHRYSVQWDRSTKPEEIRWYVDDELYHTVKAGDVDAATWAKATDHGYFVLVNLAIGGAFPGPTDATTRPGASLLVNSITVSRR
jgi:beta-glucanase (GH16 family)